MKTAIWWIRRDLRLTDNQALYSANAIADSILPVFILDPRLKSSFEAAPKRAAFLVAGLRNLDAMLKKRGSSLVVRAGLPEEVLPQLMLESGAEAIFAEEDFTPFARRRDAAVSARAPLTLTGGLTVHHPQTILKKDGTPYTVFTPFSKRWRANLPARLPRNPAPETLRTPTLPSDPLPPSSENPSADFFPAGEAEARRRLRAFISGNSPPVFRYHTDRDRLDIAGTSALSPYFRFGMLSAIEAVSAAQALLAVAPDAAAEKGVSTWLNELIWREFYHSVGFHFPHALSGNFRQQYDAVQWENDPIKFEAWKQGQTGYPVVDAAMRQLKATGWMHNRARMIVASFLVKDLHIDWRWGEDWFWQCLLDGDRAANNGGWQWAAGTGTDAAPYFRIFNPVTQGKKFDPHGQFVRQWLPELAHVPEKIIHTPGKLSPNEQKRAGFFIGTDYPSPIVDHAIARQRTLAMFRATR